MLMSGVSEEYGRRTQTPLCCPCTCASVCHTVPQKPAQPPGRNRRTVAPSRWACRRAASTRSRAIALACVSTT
ncbi:hypothetical protein Pelo_317 [Pelomyxa schiedti]|nr:hypothetical protein Pelo_317 [Pelomyxa schiedti]